MKELITNKRKCKGKIKSAGTNPAEIFLSSCILPANCFKKSYFTENFWREREGNFSLFVIGVDAGVKGRKSPVGDFTGRLTDGLPGNPTTIRTSIYNLFSKVTQYTFNLLTTPILIPHIPLTHDTLYSSLQTPSKTKDLHNKKAPSTA